MSNVQLHVISSLEKVLSKNQKVTDIKSLRALQNQPVSFQVIITNDKDFSYGDWYITFDASSTLKSKVNMYNVKFAPCTYSADNECDSHYITKKPALIPDVLFPYHGEAERLRPESLRNFFVEVTPSVEDAVGAHTITVYAKTRAGEVVAKKEITLDVINAQLPEQKIIHTEWFHNDCLAYEYGCEMFSDRYFELLKNYVSYAKEHSVNMIMTPVFTPSLDVEEMGERMKAQLIKVQKEGDAYTFDFSLFERWVHVLKECGTEYFEIAPLFTQWGSKYAVRVYGTENGEEKCLFGWQTSARSKDYAHFLSQFLPALVQELEKLNIKDKTFFHVSDEPTMDNIEAYKKACNLIKPYIDNLPIIDALSDYDFYKRGLLDNPVVANTHIQEFIKGKVKNLWAYYCCGQGNKVSNRFMAMPSYRNRVIGLQMYLYNIKGFLHWGYNFWNTQFSLEHINPYIVTDGGGGFQSGDAFLVYPGKDGHPVPSLRMKILRDAFVDMRVLSLLENLVGRKETEALIEKHYGKVTFKKYKHEQDAIEKLMDEALLIIKKHK